MCSNTRDAIAALDEVLDAVSSDRPADLPDAELRDRLIALRYAQRRLAGLLARHLAAFDARGMGDADACPSTAAWVRTFLRAESGEAADLVTQARTARDLPALADAFTAGGVGPRQVAAVGRLARRAGAAVVAAAEGVLVEQARTLPADQFVRLCREIRDRVDTDGADNDDAKARADRYLTTSVYQHTVFIEGKLDAAGGAVFLAALDAAVAAPGEDDDRLAGQRRADALVDLCRRALTATAMPAKGGLRPQTLLQVTPEALRGADGAPQPELHGIGPVGVGAARVLACDSQVMRLVLDPATRQPLDLGRTVRTAPESLRRLLIARDRGCVFPGCGRPPGWCDVHHLRPWWAGGPTSADNCCLLCRYHHVKVDTDGWMLTRDPATGAVEAAPPDTTSGRRRSAA